MISMLRRLKRFTKSTLLALAGTTLRKMQTALATNVYLSDFPRTPGDNSFLSHSYGDFDEWGYLLFNPDVARAVRRGELPSGRAHYEAVGASQIQKRNRPPVPDYRAMSYILRNPDVFDLMITGQLKSGHHHYEKIGRSEELAGVRKPYISQEPRQILSAEQKKTWSQGYLVLKNFFDAEEIDGVVERIKQLWQDRASDRRPIEVDCYLDSPHYKTLALSGVPEDARFHPLKINNLYYWDGLIRRMLLDTRLASFLRTLLDGDPCVLTSLNFERGSQQPPHLDTFYMPPVIPYRMVAAWVALEDVDPDSGPLWYVPGSNRIPPFVFNHGHIRWNSPEMPDFHNYMDRKMAELGLRGQTFCPKKGDVFVWHPLLYHAGSKINNPALTRRSLVAHYFAAADYPLGSVSQATNIIMHDTGRYYENRITLNCPAEPQQTSWPAG